MDEQATDEHVTSEYAPDEHPTDEQAASEHATDERATSEHTPRPRGPIRKSTVVIFLVVVALIVLVAVLATMNRDRAGEQVSDGSLRLSAGETQLREYSYDEIRAFPSVDVDKTISSSKEEDESGIFTGVPLELLLDDAEPTWRDKYSEFIFHASDGFVASVFASDVEKGENVIVVFEKDGEALKGPDEGGKGPLRIVVADDPFGNRSVYLLTSIEAR